MTQFTKMNLAKDGMYLFYVADGERKFVARFKHVKDGISSFATFLIKNFTVEEYFTAYDAGVAPLKIVEAKGYLLPHIKKWLKRDGYEVSLAGFEKFITDQQAKRAA